MKGAIFIEYERPKLLQHFTEQVHRRFGWSESARSNRTSRRQCFSPPDGAKNYSDILKFSNQQGFTLMGCRVDQGTDDSVDMNRFCKDIVLDGTFGIGVGGNQVLTIKGGCKNIWVTGTSHGNRVEIGNWSDQTYDLSENILVNLTSVNGQPIMVSIGRAKNVSLQGNCKKDTFGSLKLTAYWWIKWIVRKILCIKVGQSGPSWL